MNEVWNLEPIYKGFDDPAFDADMKALKEMVEKLQAFSAALSNMDSLQGLKQGIALQEQFSDLVNKLAGYASLRQAANTRDPEAGSRMGQVMQLYSGVAAPLAAWKDWASKVENLQEVVAGDADLKEYTFLFKNLAESSKYLLPGVGEAVMAKMGMSGSDGLPGLSGAVPHPKVLQVPEAVYQLPVGLVGLSVQVIQGKISV